MMLRMRDGPSVKIFTVLSLVLSACATGGNLSRIEDSQGLPTEVGADLHRFEVREGVVPRPSALAVRQDAVPLSRKNKLSKKSSRVQSPTFEKAAVLKDRGPHSLDSPAPSVFEYPQRRPKVDPIWVGEKATYDINYLGMNAGDFTLQVLPFKEINRRKVYHVFGEAKSSKVFSLFYSLKDTIETFIDYQAWAPHRFHIVLDESKQKRNSLELYDSEKGETFFWNRWNHHKKGYIEIKDRFPMKPLSQDSLSSLMYLRTQELQDGDVVRFPVISEGKNWEAEVTVLRREMINSPLGRVRAIVLKPETKYQGILKKQGDSFIWLTDDSRKVLLRLEAKVRIGTVVAVLKSFESGMRSDSDR
ncbi:MAG: hypothetical protein RJB38_1370 [Pseudomonadota bacterium]|jgi:hypothetical protein